MEVQKYVCRSAVCPIFLYATTNFNFLVLWLSDRRNNHTDVGRLCTYKTNNNSPSNTASSESTRTALSDDASHNNVAALYQKLWGVRFHGRLSYVLFTSKKNRPGCRKGLSKIILYGVLLEIQNPLQHPNTPPRVCCILGLCQSYVSLLIMINVYQFYLVVRYYYLKD